jgi:D-beta-D-heptose 7-phosphate kinase/D-beta-D-heptose 1-phosphate adenosyltransferase
MKIVLCTGGYDPLHSGHIAYFNAAKKLGDKLIVGVNSDAWLNRKKGRPFLPYNERVEIIRNLKDVYYTLDFNDDDDSSCDAIVKVRQMFPSAYIIFANGGDRTRDNIPEMRLNDPYLEFQFGVGGNNKLNSSSWILQNWAAPRTDKTWGYYKVVYENGPKTKVKELVCDPHSKLSLQRHFDRKEFWFFMEGEGYINTLNINNEIIRMGPINNLTAYLLIMKSGIN